MKKLLFGLLMCSSDLGFAQKQFEKMPEGTAEIHFKYECSSKMLIDETGVYADSVLFKYYFPKLKFTKVLNPTVQYLNSTLELKDFKGDKKKELISFLYHLNQSYYGVHDIKSNKTRITVQRNDADIKAIFRKYFNKDYSLFSFTEEFDYTNKMKYTAFPSGSYAFPFDKVQIYLKPISKTKGEFMKEISGKRESYNNLVDFDENLSKYISLGYIFANSDYGVTKVESFESKLELTEVYYK
ncbi:hypothetical protein [Flavobacterium tegetincola]|uniref:hypothetical protein n=1 Tax=Flavobacterium tegetincola TaxID=150172 RepID=UPI0004089E59|nr:hypothetical protein [Flavobacterium tegetincola]